jgi:succinate dehydrogenase/fumarate reductase flavoprotein subunit
MAGRPEVLADPQALQSGRSRAGEKVDPAPGQGHDPDEPGALGDDRGIFGNEEADNDGGEDIGEDRKHARKEAEDHEDRDGLRALGKAAEVVERLAAAVLARQAALGREDGEGKKRRARADERQDQERGRYGVLRPRQGEAEGHAGIDDEIADDVEIAAEIR